MSRADPRVGLLVGAVCGLVYVLVDAGPVGGAAAVLLRVLGVAGFVGVLLALRRAPTGGGPLPDQYGRGYRVVVAAEVVAGLVGAQVIGRLLDAPDAVLAWITLVVGVHFVGLALVWRTPSLHVVGGALTACGVAGLVLAAAGSGRAPVAVVAGVVPGAVLLLGSLAGARRTA